MWVDDKPVDLVPPDWHFILSQCFLKVKRLCLQPGEIPPHLLKQVFFYMNYDVVPSFTGWMAHWGISQSFPKHLNVPKAHQWIQKGNAEFGEGSRLNNKAKGSKYFGTCQWWQKMANSCCEKPKKTKTKQKQKKKTTKKKKHFGNIEKIELLCCFSSMTRCANAGNGSF